MIDSKDEGDEGVLEDISSRINTGKGQSSFSPTGTTLKIKLAQQKNLTEVLPE